MKIEREEISLLGAMALLDFWPKVCKRERVCVCVQEIGILILGGKIGEMERALAVQKEGPK